MSDPTTPEDLPDELRLAVKRYMSRPLAEPDALQRMVKGYRAEVHEASSSNFFVNIALADELADTLLRLLEQVGPDAPDYQRRLVQAGVYYFAADDDVDDDMGSMFGFDDDAEVVRAIDAYLSAQD